jgi:cellulase (glycosyl hydrolase family 5)
MVVGVSLSANAPEPANPRSAPGPAMLQTAILDQPAFAGQRSDAAFSTVADTGATIVRLVLDWRGVAPETLTPEFSASDPGSPRYEWKNFDFQVRAAVRHGLRPIVDIASAPAWATARPVRGGPYKPDPARLAEFAKAAALRYSGGFKGLPRVRYWQLWNEPNLAVYLRPQFVGSALYSPHWYRRMLNAFADAVHAVHPDNLVIAGATAPFTTRAGNQSSWGPGPLLFLRTMLCFSKKLKPTCSQQAHFDIWAHHPYTSGGPNHHANNVDDVSIADLPQMKALLDLGVWAGHIVSRNKLRFWVTEFSWDTNPPDPNAMPLALQTRWVSEALYKMWASGVSLVTWFLLEDQPRETSPYQSGLYFRNGEPKPTLRAFRFPFVAYLRVGVTDIWGRTPSSKPGTVAIEQQSGGAWKRLGTVNTNAFGIFRDSYLSKPKGPLRARLIGSSADASEPFSLEEPPDESYRPFGEP